MKLFPVSAAMLLVAASATPAYAYLDAGTGSMILQLLLGGVAGLAMVGKLYWSNAKAFFQRQVLGRGAPDAEAGDDGYRGR